MSASTILAVARWILARLLREPFVWGWLVMVFALWPGIQTFSPIGLTTANLGATGILYEIAFLSLLVGCTLSLGALGQGGRILEQAPIRRRLSAETTGMIAGGCVFLAAGTAVPIAWSWWSVGGGGQTIAVGRDLLPRAALSLLHLTGLGLLILRLPAHGIPRAVLLPVIAWILPALVGAAGTGGEIAYWVLGAARHLAEGMAPEPTPTALGAALGPIIALVLAASLIGAPSRRDP